MDKKCSDEFLRAAPCLSQLWVSTIRTDFGMDENPLPNQKQSINGHAGRKWAVWTSEYGYGVNPIAKLNGKNLTKTGTSTILDQSGLVIGFTHKWEYDGDYLSGGTLDFHDDSRPGSCQTGGKKTMDIEFIILPYSPPKIGY